MKIFTIQSQFLGEFTTKFKYSYSQEYSPQCESSIMVWAPPSQPVLLLGIPSASINLSPSLKPGLENVFHKFQSCSVANLVEVEFPEV